MNKFEQRRLALQNLVTELGRGGIARVAKRIGKEPSYVSRMLYPPEKSGAKRIGEASHELLANAYPKHFSAAASVTTLTPAPEAGAAATHIPLLANAGSMGTGTDIEPEDVIVGTLAISTDWLEKRIRPSAFEALRFIHAYGDSMSPTFEDGDVLLVDTGRRDPSGADGVYVLATSNRLFIKRVTEHFDGKLAVTSDNTNVKLVQELSGDQEISILGRVVWVWNGRKI